MSKRAIYLDERERDLARRIFTAAVDILNNAEIPGRIKKLAILWTHDEILKLREKFEEPVVESAPPKDTT